MTVWSMGLMTHHGRRLTQYSGGMRGNIPKRLVMVIAAAALALGLSGCLKFDMDMKVGANEKVNGTFVVALNEGVLSMMGQKPDAFVKEMLKDDISKDVPKGAKVSRKAYRKDGWAGMAIEYKDMPVSEFSKSAGKAAGGMKGKTSASDTFTLKKVKDNYEFAGTIDFSSGAGSTTADADESMNAMMKQFKPEMRIKMTFPGKVVKANGKISGKSVTWVPVMGKKSVMKATAKAS